MERIWNFFENMNEYVYVADADTHELVYMNKKMRDTYGNTFKRGTCRQKML